MDAVKFSDVAETTVSGLAAPFGGPFSGKDLDGEYFSKSTDFALDWYDEIPLIYHHGRDATMQTTMVGRVKSRAMTDDGVWAEAQLDASNKYFEVIKKLIKAGKLFFSSSAPPHLVQTDRKSGEIRRWPMYELSLTPTPSNLLAVASAKAMTGNTPMDSDDGDPPEGSYEDLISDLTRGLQPKLGGYAHVLATFPDHAIVASYGQDYNTPSYYRVAYSLDANGEPVIGDSTEVQRMYVPGGDNDTTGNPAMVPNSSLMLGESSSSRAIDLAVLAEKAVMHAAQRNKLPDSDFGYVDSDGKGHFPINDEDHVHAAISMFSRASFPDAATKKRCAGKILSRAKKYGIDVADDSAVAQAAHGKSVDEAVLRMTLRSIEADFDAILAR